MVSNISAFFRLPIKDKCLLFEAVVFLFAAKILLSILPFKTCVKTIKKIDSDLEIDQEKLIRIKLALARANRLAFWRNVCLVQSFAGRWMLERRGIGSELVIGLRVDEKVGFGAHAWLKVGEMEITHDGGEYHELHVL